eukprot:6462859-Amphidinium_carterae.1
MVALPLCTGFLILIGTETRRLIELRSKCWVLSTAVRTLGEDTASLLVFFGTFLVLLGRRFVSDRRSCRLGRGLSKRKSLSRKWSGNFFSRGTQLEGLRCTECGKGASDIAGRPRWSYFREFRCVPKRRRGRPRRLFCMLSPFSWMRLGRLRSGRDALPKWARLVGHAPSFWVRRGCPRSGRGVPPAEIG